MSLLAITHTVRFPAREANLVDVESSFPCDGARELELMMPVWAPGSYLVREFARHLEGFAVRAADESGAPQPGPVLRWEKTRKNRWRIRRSDGGTLPPRVLASYRLFARDLTVRTNHVDSELALLQGAGTWLTPVGEQGIRPHPHLVRVERPVSWPVLAMPLPAGPDSGPTASFVARDFDQLVDSPLFAGRAEVETRTVGGRPHQLVTVGNASAFPHQRAADDLARIATVEHDFWGTVPYPSYLVLNLLGDGFGGLEHQDATLLLFPRFKAATRKGYLEWLGLLAHELFHAWNGKRLRPRELGPFDYENEVYTRELWFVEGITSYFDDLLVHRAGLSRREEYLGRLSEHLQRLAATPGRAVQSLSQSSFDTWIKFYRPDENSASSSVSYYLKGALAAFVLDAALRRAGERRGLAPAADRDDLPCLDRVLREAYGRHAGSRGFLRGELVELFSTVAGEDFAPLLTATLDETRELDVAAALATFGLRLAPPPTETANQGAGKGWAGWTLRRDDGRVWVSEARRGTPAASAGINAGDELLGLDGYRVNPGGWDERLAICRPGDQVELLLARRERVLTVPLTLGSEPPPLAVEIDPAASAQAIAQREHWLGGGGRTGRDAGSDPR
jgi:predicted metalloprotease with PDZ domain